MTVVHLHLNRSSRLRDMIRDTVTFRTRIREEPGTSFIAVDPFFNYCSGLRVRSDSNVKSTGGRRTLRHLLVRALAPLALLRDVFFTPCFVLAAVWKSPGRFDACLGIGPWGSLVGLILRAAGKVKVLVYEDRDYDPGLLPDRLRRWYTAVVERFVQRRADVVISVGHRLAELRRRESGVEPAVISNGIEWERFEQSRRTSGRSNTLIYVGNISPWCGLEQNIRALPHLRRSIPDVRLLVVGSGMVEDERFFRQLALEMGLEGVVDFAGSQPHAQLPAFMARAAIGLANSQPVSYRQFACPLKVIEYMAAGLPVLATENTEAADMVGRYRSGVAAAYEASAIAAACERLLRDRTTYEQMRDNAMSRSRDLDWRVLLEREQALIEEALTRTGRKGRMHIGLEQPSCA